MSLRFISLLVLVACASGLKIPSRNSLQRSRSIYRQRSSLSPVVRTQIQDVYKSSRLFSSAEAEEGKFEPIKWLDINTRGGIIVWSGILTLIPIGFYNYFISQGYEESRVGAYVGALFVLLSLIGWGSTYIFRVATKDMTYAKQLRDYENAVLQKRLEELADDEIDALMKEIEDDDDDVNAGAPTSSSASASSPAQP
jgi:Protein of unknown function (DUF3007)